MRYSLYPALLGLTGFMLALFQPALAQSNWVTGYVVNNGGDTLRGQVDDRDWQRSPESVRFRQIDQTGELTYPVGELQAFYVGPAAQRFIRRVGTLNMDDPKATFLPEKPTPNWVADTVFMQVLQQGPLSLAIHRDTRGISHYLIRADTAANWQELLLLRFRDKANTTREFERYRQQLFLATSGCPAVQNRASAALLQENNLKQLIGAYNRCRGSNEVSQPTAQPTGRSLEWGGLAGLSLTSIKFTGGYFSQPVTYRSSVSPTVGVWVAYYLTKRRKKWAAYADVRYQGYSATTSSAPSAPQQNTLTYRYLKVYTGFRWQYPGRGAIKPFIVAGVSNGFQAAYSRTITVNGDRKHEQGLFAGLGLGTDRLRGELRYERGNGMSDFQNLSSLTSTLIGQIMLRF